MIEHISHYPICIRILFAPTSFYWQQILSPWLWQRFPDIFTKLLCLIAHYTGMITLITCKIRLFWQAGVYIPLTAVSVTPLYKPLLPLDGPWMHPTVLYKNMNPTMFQALGLGPNAFLLPTSDTSEDTESRVDARSGMLQGVDVQITGTLPIQLSLSLTFHDVLGFILLNVLRPLFCALTLG